MARQSIGVLQAYGGKWHLRCRPPYEEQNARISILVNGIAERPDTFVQTVLGQLQKPLADGAGHTFAPAAETWARTIVESTIWTR